MKIVPGYTALLGEGVIWNHEEQKLYWIDIKGKKIIVQDTTSHKTQLLSLNQQPGSIACTSKHTLILALEDGVYYTEETTGNMKQIFPNKNPGKTRFNDGKCDPAGRFWVGTMDLKFKKPIGKLFRIDPDFSVQQMVSGVTISNGITWSPDNKRMYYIDTTTNKVAAYYFNNSNGTIRFDRFTIIIPDHIGNPDGCTIDSEGMLWIAMWNGNCITRWNPENGTLLQKIKVPAFNVTSLAFGGPDLDTLYITTAAIETPDQALYPDAGSLFAFKPGVRGIKQAIFHLST